MLRLSRLVWRDAASRYWGGLTVACVPAVYLWREWPPWVVRDALWGLSGVTLLCVFVVAAVVYALLSAGPTRQLVASERLQYWRQQPIEPGAWRVFHGVHLLLLHAPALGALGYFLAPAGFGVSVGGPGAIAVGVLGPVAWRLGQPIAEPRAWSIRLPSVSSRPVALARVLTLAMLRRRPAALAGIVAASIAIAALGRVAIRHVLSAGEPPHPAGWGFAAATVTLGAVAVWTAWPLVRREQWWLDMMGADAATQRTASVLLAAVTTTPAVLLLSPAAASLGLPGGLGMLGVALGTAVWAGAATMLLDADAVRRREPMTRRSGRFVLVLALPIPLSAWHPLALLLPCVLVWWRAAAVGKQAAVARRRFELEDIEDDHD